MIVSYVCMYVCSVPVPDQPLPDIPSPLCKTGQEKDDEEEEEEDGVYETIPGDN